MSVLVSQIELKLDGRSWPGVPVLEVPQTWWEALRWEASGVELSSHPSRRGVMWCLRVDGVPRLVGTERNDMERVAIALARQRNDTAAPHAIAVSRPRGWVYSRTWGRLLTPDFGPEPFSVPCPIAEPKGFALIVWSQVLDRIAEEIDAAAGREPVARIP